MDDSYQPSMENTSEKRELASPADLEGNNPPTAAPSPPDQLQAFRSAVWFLVVAATLSSNFLYALDNTIVSDIIPIIVNDFQSVEQLSWLSVGFMLGGVTAIMPMGKIYGLFNVKWVYIFSVIIFEAASALCGGSPNMSAMIVGRVFAGVGGIGMYIGTMTLLSVNTSDQERPAYLSLVGLVWGAGTVLGPVVGGGFEKYNWRFAFYINLFIGALMGPVYIFLLPGVNFSAGISLKERLSSFDFLGAVLSTAGMTTIFMAINFGGSTYAWDSGPIIALFILSGVLFVAFGIQQKFCILTSNTTRMFPVHFFRNKEALVLHILAAACNASLFIPIYFIPIYFQFTRGDTALDSAVRLLPLIIVLVAFILSNGFLMSKSGFYWPWYLIGAALALVANVLFSRITATTSTAAISGFEVLLGAGTGSFVQAGYAVIQAVVDPVDTNYAISFMMIAQIGGIAIGLSISGAVFINSATNALITLLPNVSISQIQETISGTSSALFESLDDADRDLVLDAILKAMQKVFIVAYVGAAVCVVGSALLRRNRVFVTSAPGA